MRSDIDCRSIKPQALNALIGPEPPAISCRIEDCVTSSGVDPKLLHLVRVRVSQLNDCVVCIEAHMREARRAGEGERRLVALNAWRSGSYFTPAERAALEWVEAVTTVVGRQVPDWIYQAAREHLDDSVLRVLGVATARITTSACPTCSGKERWPSCVPSRCEKCADRGPCVRSSTLSNY